MFVEVVKREVWNVNKDYFGFYSVFGIYWEMFFDKVWIIKFGVLVYNFKLCFIMRFG